MIGFSDNIKMGKIKRQNDYRSKTLQVQCGYCDITMNYENWKKYCLQIHKKSMKIFGEVDMKSFLKPKTQSLDNDSSSKDDLEYSHEMNCESDFVSPEISYKNKTNDSNNNE